MSKTLAQAVRDATRPVMIADVVRSGEKITIPEGMTLEETIASIQRAIEFEQKETQISNTFDVFPWDGAAALQDVLTAKYGYAEGVVTPGTWFTREQPPQMMSIDIAYNRKKLVPWGRLIVPGVEGYLECGAQKVNNRFMFSLTATVKRKYELVVQEIFDLVQGELRRNSIYKGKAIKIRFKMDNGKDNPLPEPKFLDAESVDENMLVFSERIMNSIRTNLFTPIMRAQDCLDNNLTVKRGILLGGIYGTGKTLAAAVASKLAVTHGITYIYVPRANELREAIEFAKQYQSPAAVVFCEDVDRVITGERSVAMDDILNTIDGIDSKSSNIVVVLTTNHLEQINPAMLRPGRLDAVIEITPPDAKAVEQLIRNYAGGSLSRGADLSKVGEMLSGQIPAVVAEVVKRAKLSQLALQEPGSYVTQLTGEALCDAASTMEAQIRLLTDMIEKGKEKPPEKLETAMLRVVKRAVNEAETEAA